MKKNRYVGNKYKPQYYDELHKLRKYLCLRINKKYLFIEGDPNKKFKSNDEIVYSKVINQNCQTIPSNTKDGIVKDFKEVYNNQIAIVDKDYDDNDVIQNLYYTDYNDIECTAINILNNSSEIFKCMALTGISENDFEKNIYNKAIVVASKISSFNKYIKVYNNKYNKKYKYVLNMIVDKNAKQTTIGDIRRIKRIISKDGNINYNELINIYRCYDNGCLLTIDSIQKAMTSYVTNDFRGHDFFIILAYLIDYYSLKFISDIKDDFKFHPCEFIEKKFIDYFSNTKRIKESNMYEEIKSTKKGFLE